MRLLLLSLLLTPALLWAQEKNYDVIRPNADNVFYTGRVDFTHPERPVFAYPGVQIEIIFEGSFIEVILEDLGTGGDEHTNYVQVFIDDQTPVVLKLPPGKKTYPIAKNLNDDLHSVTVIKRTESSVGKIVFHGAHIQKGKTLLADVTKLNTRRIEFIGDSFTAGYGNEVSVAAPPNGDPNTGFHSVNENNYTAWGAITCRNLEADYMCTAYSGRGLMRNNTGSSYGTMPLIYDQIIADDESTHWDHTLWPPDVIVISLGTNDFFTGVPDSAAFVNTYIEFVKRLRSIHPEASIICVAGNGVTDFWPEGEFRWTHMQNYIQSVVKSSNNSGDENVYYLMLSPQTPPYGEDWHPSNATHQKMAVVTTEFIKRIKKW